MTPLKRKRLSDPRRPSQDQVAEAVGITQSFYLRIENGERAASPELAAGIADFFGVRVGDLFEPSRYSSEPATVEV